MDGGSDRDHCNARGDDHPHASTPLTIVSKGNPKDCAVKDIRSRRLLDLGYGFPAGSLNGV
jgi:hypothetical protein